MSNQRQLENECHKPILRKFKIRKVYSSFKDNIWGDDLADILLISKFYKGIRYLLCAIDLFSKYWWVVSLKSKKVIANLNAFENVLGSPKSKSNKIQVDQASEF